MGREGGRWDGGKGGLVWERLEDVRRSRKLKIELHEYIFVVYHDASVENIRLCIV